MGYSSIHSEHECNFQSISHCYLTRCCRTSPSFVYVFPKSSNCIDLVLVFVQTFDDGPTNVTSTLLDYLDSVNQKTTFFEIGSQVADNYLLTQREYASGHQIADHTWSHPDLTQLSPEQVYAELLWTIYVIQASIGQIPKYFRPPYGFINNNVRTVAAQLNLTVRFLQVVFLTKGCCVESRYE